MPQASQGTKRQPEVLLTETFWNPRGVIDVRAKMVDTEYDRAKVSPYNGSDPTSPLES